jgi:hypothetical protein
MFDVSTDVDKFGKIVPIRVERLDACIEVGRDLLGVLQT